MRDIGAFEFGARIIQASSYHSKFLPNNIVDRQGKDPSLLSKIIEQQYSRGTTRPWISTGLYPQYFVISFPDQMQIHTIDMKSFNGRTSILEIEFRKMIQGNFLQFTKWKFKEALQTCHLTLKTFLKSQ